MDRNKGKIMITIKMLKNHAYLLKGRGNVKICFFIKWKSKVLNVYKYKQDSYLS